MPTLQRLAMGVQYDGTAFHGWQFQRQAPHLPTIQGALEAALSHIANEPITSICAGRTDSGVHALAQVIHFDTTAHRTAYDWMAGVNAKLPPAIAVQWVKPVSIDFHARFSARARSYRYIIYQNRARQALMRQCATWVKTPLDVPAMQQAAQLLIGTHDFSALRSSHCQANNAIRQVSLSSISAQGPWLIYEVSANAFLHHMVRNIVGTLLVVGRREQPPAWVSKVLASRDRCQAGVTAPPQGLCLRDVCYPSSFALPKKSAQDFSLLETLLS